MAVNPVNIDRIEYTLFHKDFGSLTITEPVGWDADEKELSRHKDYHGIFAKFSNSLKFIGDGAQYITTIYNVYGINEVLTLRRRERHPHTNKWITSYIGVIDLSTYEIEEGQVSVKFNNSGLEELLKARQSEKIELDRLDDLDGNAIPELETINVLQDGRRIFLKTEYTVSETNNEAKASVESNAGNTRTQTVGIPLKLVTNSHIDIAKDVTPQSTGGDTVGDLDMMFMFDNNRDRILDIDIDATMDIFCQQHENVDWARYWISLSIYENGFDFNLKQRIPLYALEDNHPWFGNDLDYAMPQFTQQGVNVTYSNPTFELLAGESLAFECWLKSDMHTDNNAGVRVYAQNIVINNFKIDENSYFEPSVTKAILAYEMGNRITRIITGKEDAFTSDALGRTDIGYSSDGYGALTGYTHGFWIRGFDKDDTDEENRFKPLTTSFKKYMESLSSVWNMGLGIEAIGYKERIRIESLKYFYNNNVTIRLGKEIDGSFVFSQVKKVKRSVATENYFSDLTIGYNKGWENEEAMGLDEPNTKTTLGTAITRIKNSFQAICDYITASYAKEFIRRKPKTLYPTTDHKNDKEIFMMDLKRGSGGVFLERKWQDDFQVEPEGIFSPETAVNLRFTPFNMLLRHGWVVASGLYRHYVDKYTRYLSSEGNSGLITKLSGGNEYSENGNILNSELERPRFIPEWVEFEYPCDFETMQQVEGVFINPSNGKKIPNFYGLVQFENENGDLEKGYLFNLKPNGEGKWKLLKANR